MVYDGDLHTGLVTLLALTHEYIDDGDPALVTALAEHVDRPVSAVRRALRKLEGLGLLTVYKANGRMHVELKCEVTEHSTKPADVHSYEVHSVYAEETSVYYYVITLIKLNDTHALAVATFDMEVNKAIDAVLSQREVVELTDVSLSIRAIKRGELVKEVISFIDSTDNDCELGEHWYDSYLTAYVHELAVTRAVDKWIELETQRGNILKPKDLREIGYVLNRHGLLVVKVA